jgi:endoglucanase
LNGRPLEPTIRPAIMISKLALAAIFIIATLTKGAENDRFLKAHGNEIRDAAEKTVHLRGVNLGGWLVFEPWMCPMDSSGTLKDDDSARETLAKRFGTARARELLDIYQENWLTEQDFDNIAALGLNVIRIPFWYRNLQTEDGAWISGGLKRLDWAVAEAWKRGIYSIIDLHGAPGGQTNGVSVGRKREKAELWNNDAHLRRTAAVWRKVAQHYKGNPAVAVYDLLNEPADAPSLGALWSTYDFLYREIRAVDPDHIITVEGCVNAKLGDKQIHWGWEALPHPDFFGWKNVLYQLHHYEWDWNHQEKQMRGIDFQVAEWKKNMKLGVPAYMGEFNPMGVEAAWVHAIEQYTASGMHWTLWSYKATHGTGSDSWGLYNPIKKDAPNLLTDDESVIRAKWTAVRTSESFALNPMLDRVLRKTISPAAKASAPKP